MCHAACVPSIQDAVAVTFHLIPIWIEQCQLRPEVYRELESRAMRIAVQTPMASHCLGPFSSGYHNPINQTTAGQFEPDKWCVVTVCRGERGEGVLYER